ncbi:biotin--[acetyl-CoA-carboxylase] ligase [Pseudalkalibacillus caeni]|uniref:Bifunctional ligase/repressor BirA n=1 Tax=Exobacillus caeni TaxID=2574798 RepID=A0A5R9EZJ6_9BACL|nr:biotin--[acetyl-CoA-carboxylase] ligase [Pseudalkalibacillus caeni]TLS35889.1 biotin--[acetyl-CoA-carboxylase] ligase [Pseudalkalibacillus caeni]
MVATSMKQKMLEMLNGQEGQFVSGQKISEELGCSRTAIWKHISELRKEGYEVEAVQKKGYRITSTPNHITANEVKLGLNTKHLGQNIVYQESVTSTQEIAHRLAYDDVPEGTIVTAEEQTAGKGRLGRNWHSPKTNGIWVSLILRPKIPPQQAPQLTLLAAVGVVKAIQKETGVLAEIKWPNDVLVNGKKVVGILTELQAESDQIKSVIIGMGINVNTSAAEFPDDIKEKATSLRIEAGKELNRASLLRRILEETETLYEEYLQNGFQVVKLLWESYAVSLGKHIKARTLTGVKEGIARGITNDGVLLLEDDTGEIHQIYSADIEIC